MDEYRGKIGELKDAGVVGIEAFNSYQNESENQAFFKLAKEMDMIITAGSDFHGDTKPNVKLGCFGENVPVTIDEIIESIQLKRKKKEKGLKFKVQRLKFKVQRTKVKVESEKLLTPINKC